MAEDDCANLKGRNNAGLMLYPFVAIYCHLLQDLRNYHFFPRNRVEC